MLPACVTSLVVELLSRQQQATFCDVSGLPDYCDDWFLNINSKDDLVRLQAFFPEAEKEIDY